MKQIARITFLWLFLAAATVYGDSADKANIFWANFRKAVIFNDVARVASLTQFPLELHVRAGWPPVKYVDRKSFAEALSKVLSQQLLLGTDEYSVEKKALQVIREKVKLTGQDFLTPSSFRVGALEFEFVNDRWYFTQAYLER